MNQVVRAIGTDGVVWTAVGTPLSEGYVICGVDLATGLIRTLAGDGKAGFADGPAATARFDGPRDVAIAPDGTV